MQGLDPAMQLLRERVTGNVVEYRMVMECLRAWASPRAKLTRLLKQGALIRIHQGLYVFGSLHQKHPISLPSLSNLIFGPSYVSLEWALAYYRMIPESVVAITSVTFKQRRQYTTPLGAFIYEHIHRSLYPLGITRIERGAGETVLIATREKALIDQLILRIGRVQSLKQMRTILLDDFRIDEEELVKLNLKALQEIYDAYPHSAIDYLIRFCRKLHE